MSVISLYDYQKDAVGRLKTGSILCGGVGTGKSRTSLAYFYQQMGGDLDQEEYTEMDRTRLKDLYIITTARKRDTREWECELHPFMMSTEADLSLYSHKVIIDSWNNIGKYADVTGAFFIFDEQRVVGNGVWTKSFIKIAKNNNEWILLSATPGDRWEDYIPVFIANGFYRNRTEFNRDHLIFSRYSNYPKVEGYTDVRKLVRLRDSILVNMEFQRKTISHNIDIWCDYDYAVYNYIQRNYWDIWKQEPITNAAGLCYALRKAVNTDEQRLTWLLELMDAHPKMIVFYNFDYELDLIKSCKLPEGTEVAEWNGHKHQPIPKSDKWLYLVQYNAGAEGWNCIQTDTIVFFSQNYSYKVMAQSSGRIDRLNTPYTDLWYYHLKSKSKIDLAISRALKEKKNFNETAFVKWKGK